MSHWKMNRIVAVLAVVAVLAMAPAAQAQVCTACAGAAPTTYIPQTSYMPRTSYMPVATAPTAGCASCYQPETKSRWSYSRLETTTYKPVTVVDPCTGCQQTAYQPVTSKSLLPWLHRVKETVYNPVPCATNTCSPCATNTCAPCGQYASAGGCSSCFQGSSMPDAAYNAVPTPTYQDQNLQKAPIYDAEPDKTIEADPVLPTPPAPALGPANGENQAYYIPNVIQPTHQRVSWVTTPTYVRAPVAQPTVPVYTQPARKIDFSGWEPVSK